MRSCPACHNSQIRNEALFCDLCGTRLSLSTPAMAAVAGRGPVVSPAAASGPAFRPPVRPPLARPGRPPAASLGPARTWAEIERSAEVPDELNVEGMRWVKVDEIEPRNRESEIAHSWSINETRQVFQERGAKAYPDGNELCCRGYLHKGGFARFTIRNLVPQAPVAMLRQVWAEGREEGEVYVGEYTAGAFRHTDLDLQHPMRNRVHLIPRSLVTGAELTVEQEDLGSENGLYYFGLKFYQPADAVEALATSLARAAATGNAVRRSDSAPLLRVVPPGAVMSWEAIRKMGKALPETMKLLNRDWDLVDFMSFDSQQSLEEHSFAVYDAESYFTFKLKSIYPDGEEIEDSGIRWDRGCAEWTVGGTRANRELAVIFRLDVRECPGSIEVFCDDQPAGSLQIDGRDPVNRWRNWNHLIPARLVSEGTARLRFALPQGSAPMNLFRLWFYAAR